HGRRQNTPLYMWEPWPAPNTFDRMNDRAIAAQLGVFPDQFEIILGKLAGAQADVSAVIGEMKLLLEQTDDTVRFVEDTRPVDRHDAVPN
ncbi:MAG: hypothetical protein ACREBE_06515, partial [bacterium]